MAADYLPPVVVSIVLNDAEALASLAGFKSAVAETSASVGAGTGKLKTTVEQDMAEIASVLGNESPYERATRAAGNAERGIESGSKGFASRVGTMFESLGNSMGSFGIPFGNSVKKLGYSYNEAETAGKGFGASLRSIGNIAMGAGLLVAAGIGVMSIKAADAFDVAQTRLRQAVKNTGNSFAQFEPSLDKTESHLTNLGFKTSETAEALGTLTVSTHSPTKAMEEMGLAADLARYKNISLAQTSETLAKVNAGSLRPLMQLGIQIDVGSLKLTAAVKATEAVTKAKKALKVAEENMTAAIKKGSEEHAAAIAKEQAAVSSLKSAQDAVKSDSESLASAQENLKNAQRGVTEAAENQKRAIKEAAAALKQAEEAARETAEAGAKGIAGAKKNLSNLEKERAKEANESAISQINSQIAVAEATKTAAGEAAVAELTARRASLEAADNSITAGRQEQQMQEAHESVIEAETNAHKNNKNALSSVTAAREKLAKAHKDALASSKENVAASQAVTAAERGVSGAVIKLGKDQEAAGRAATALGVAQQAVAAKSKAVVQAQQKLAAAHEKVAATEATLQKDQISTGKVLDALKEKIGGTAAAFGQTLAGQADIAKAKLNQIAVTIGERLTPVLLALIEIVKGMVSALAPVWQAFVHGVQWVAIQVANLYVKWVENWHGIRSTTESVVHVIGAVISTGWGIIRTVTIGLWKTIEFVFYGAWVKLASIVNDGVSKVIGFFTSMPEKIVHVLSRLVSDMKELGANLVHALISGIESAPGAVLNALKGLVPGGANGILGKAASVIGLAEGGLITSPTLAVVGESGPEMVIPLRNVNADPNKVRPLAQGGPGGFGTPSASQAASAAGSSGLQIGTVQINGSNQSNTDIVNEMYRKLRPLLQGA